MSNVDHTMEARKRRRAEIAEQTAKKAQDARLRRLLLIRRRAALRSC